MLKGVVGETPVTEANFLAWRTKKEAEDDSGKPALSAEMKEKLARPTGRQLFERDASLYTHAAQPCRFAPRNRQVHGHGRRIQRRGAV